MHYSCKVFCKESIEIARDIRGKYQISRYLHASTENSRGVQNTFRRVLSIEHYRIITASPCAHLLPDSCKNNIFARNL